jgi:hypothetical protein
VEPVRIFYNEQPPALPAVCAQVLVVPAMLDAATAHVSIVGNPAVQGTRLGGTSQIQEWSAQLPGLGVRAYGASGSAAADKLTVQAVDVVGGVPPRGRPV